MERNAFIALAICFLILIIYQEVTQYYYPHPEEVPSRVAQPTAPRAEPPAPAEPQDDRAGGEEPAEPVVQVEGTDVVLENDLFRAVLTTAGARLKSLQLKRFRVDVAPDSPPLDLVQDSPPDGLPLGLVLRRNGSQIDDAGVLYQVDRDSLALSGSEEGVLTFRGVLGGAQVVKRIRATGDRYFFEAEVDVESGSGQPPARLAITWQDELGQPPPMSNAVVTTSVLAIEGGKLQRFRPHCGFFDRHCQVLDDKENSSASGDHVGWVAFDERYFLEAIIPETSNEETTEIEIHYRDGHVHTQLLFPAGETTARFYVYMGPKKIEILESAPRSLRPALDLGMFTFISLPLLHVLRLSHRVTGNYGVDIILLTVLIKVLFIPLTQKSMRSMREMQKLQPQMTKIRERYKDKPEEMNKEIIELYRRHKVNPLGGCLPMVLQIPVFFGLYQALLNAVELRHAPFFSWINDLSAPDRLGTIHLPFVEPPGFPVLTLLMGASMFVQQLMTPTGADPTQQRMMLIMPVVFTFMFISFPSGLTLYWLVNNVLTIAQQYAINRPNR